MGLPVDSQLTPTPVAGSPGLPVGQCKVLPNIVINKSACTAESWSFWALFIGPILLRRRFSHRKYYHHFIKLLTLLNICLQFEITADEIETLREGFIKWVEDYEK
jgi:hypothetical protein